MGSQFPPNPSLTYSLQFVEQRLPVGYRVRRLTRQTVLVDDLLHALP